MKRTILNYAVILILGLSAQAHENAPGHLAYLLGKYQQEAQDACDKVQADLKTIADKALMIEQGEFDQLRKDEKALDLALKNVVGINGGSLK